MPVPKHVYIFLAFGLVAASQSGNIVRLGDAHPVIIAAWRLLFASLMLAPLAGKNLTLVALLTRKQLGLLVLAGAALALHFYLWIAAVQMTTIANASIFYAVNPLITATAGYLFFHERVSSKLAISIVLGVVGIGVLGGSDLSLSPKNVPGDAAALGCSFMFTVYFLSGKKIRQVLPTTAYVAILYGIAAAFSFGAAVVMGLPLSGYNPQTWLCFGLMALVPTMIGHTSFNNALRYIEAGRISAATLSEPLMAGVVAYFAWNEKMSAGALLGYCFICGSIVVLIFDQLKQAKKT